MSVRGAEDRIRQAVLRWKGVTIQPHRFGGTEFRLARREISHIHGNYMVDIPFPKSVRDELVTAGRAEPHHILPQSGWVSFYLKEPGNVSQAIDLLRQSFDLTTKQRDRKRKTTDER